LVPIVRGFFLFSITIKHVAFYFKGILTLKKVNDVALVFPEKGLKIYLASFSKL
jgi:hypothetical protein